MTADGQIDPESHRQAPSLRVTDPDIKRIYERERKREIDQIRYLIEKNRNRLTTVGDPQAEAMVIHHAVENGFHTARFMGAGIAEEQPANGLVDMISGFFLGNHEN